MRVTFYMQKNILKVLIVSKDWKPYKFCKTTGDCHIDVRFACCGYEISTVLQQFHPDAVALDYSLAPSELQELSSHLKNDARL